MTVVTIRMMREVVMMMVMVVGPSLAVTVVQKFVREPPDQTAAEGENVTLPCRVDNKVSTNESTVFVSRDLAQPIRAQYSGHVIITDQSDTVLI